MALYFLDSDTVISYTKLVAQAVSSIDSLSERGDLLCVSAVVVAEVFAGLAPEDLAARRFVDSLAFFPTTRSAAQQAGSWRYEYARRGITLSTYDTLIAATALDHKATIITGNLRDYPMPEVSLLQLPR